MLIHYTDVVDSVLSMKLFDLKQKIFLKALSPQFACPYAILHNGTLPVEFNIILTITRVKISIIILILKQGIGITMDPNKTGSKRKCLTVTQNLVTKVELDFQILNHSSDYYNTHFFSLPQIISFSSSYVKKGTL